MPCSVGEARVHRLHHVVDLGRLPRRRRRNPRRIDAKKSLIAPRTPLVNGLRSMLRRVRPAFARSASRPMTSKSSFVCCVNTVRSAVKRCSPRSKSSFSSLHALHHVLDDVLVLAAQLAQLRELLGDARPAARRAARARRAASARTSACVAAPTMSRLAGMSLRDSASSSAGRPASLRAARRRR